MSAAEHLFFYGCGSMGGALARGLKSAHPHWQFSFWTPSGTRAKAMAQELGGHFISTLAEIPAGVTGVVLGFKPQMLNVASAPLANLFSKEIPFISLLAAISLSELAEHFPGRPLIRLMPNLAVAENRGVVLWNELGISQTARPHWQNALAKLGLAPYVSEPLIDVYTLPAASSPAFLFQWLRDVGDYARQNGGDPQEAVAILVQAFRGTLANDLRFDELQGKIQAVASRGGVTQATLDEWRTSDPDYIQRGFGAGLKRLGELKHK